MARKVSSPTEMTTSGRSRAAGMPSMPAEDVLEVLRDGVAAASLLDVAAQRRLETRGVGLRDFGDNLEHAFARRRLRSRSGREEPVGDAGDIFGTLEIGRPPTHAAHRVLDNPEQERSLVVRRPPRLR